MNRREWLQRVCAGVVGAAVVTHVPTAWFPANVRTYAACEFLRREWLRFVDARRAQGANQWEALPGRMTAGRELFEAYESEVIVNWRFTSSDAAPNTRTLMFKGTRLIEHGTGWRVECHA